MKRFIVALFLICLFRLNGEIPFLQQYSYNLGIYDYYNNENSFFLNHNFEASLSVGTDFWIMAQSFSGSIMIDIGDYNNSLTSVGIGLSYNWVHCMRFVLIQNISLFPFTDNPFYTELEVWLFPIGMSFDYIDKKEIYLTTYIKLSTYSNDPLRIFAENNNGKIEIGLSLNIEDRYPENLSYYGLLGVFNPQYSEMSIF